MSVRRHPRTSRVEAAADAAHDVLSDWYPLEGVPNLERHAASVSDAALAASDADDLANGIRRVRVDGALVEKCAKALHDSRNPFIRWVVLSESGRQLAREHARAVLAAATDGADG